MIAIDYSQETKIQRIKSGTLLTQMQSDYLEGQERVGNFYSAGSLPGDFNERADKSGIGIKGVEKDQTISDKSVYISRVEKMCTALQSTAAAAINTWSVSGQLQESKGGGIQLRMSTGDYGKIVRVEYGQVQAREKSNGIEKSLKSGYLQPKTKNYRNRLKEAKSNNIGKSNNTTGIL